MRKLVLLGVACVAFVSGCDLINKLKGGDADAGSDAAAADAAVAIVDAGEPDAAAAPPIVVQAKNVGDVARYPGETAVPDDDAKLLQPSPARTSPKSGNVVATIPAGGEVMKVAEYQGSFLVTFPDPKDASSTLMGWIAKESFSAATRVIVKTDGGVVDAGPAPIADAGAPKADAGAAKVTCSIGFTAIVLTPGAAPVCKKKCIADANCPSKAAGACANASSQTGGVVRACVKD